MTRTRLGLVTLAGLALLVLSTGCASGGQTAEDETTREPQASRAAVQPRYEGTLPAPAFPEGLDWINATRPVTWEDLRGKIVVLDFWTYGCINCIHMIPILEHLQEKYADELVLIGVHSAKFENEKSTENIRQIAARYGRNEPIVNDSKFEVWRAWGARAWPTIAIVDPRGNVVALDAGEIPFSTLDTFVAGVLARFDALGLVDRTPTGLFKAEAPAVQSLLRFPGKVRADEQTNLLYIADSNHNRIIVAELDTGNVVEVIGSGQSGFADGSFEEATFAVPQGLAVDGALLYVADLDNHAIREVDLDNRQVRTIAGTGKRGTGGRASGEVVRNPTQFNLRSPWALETGEDGSLFIAMAGTHQVWRYDSRNGTLEVAVGDGREALVNGSLSETELAQPSGLSFSDGVLMIADSESSTIRAADLAGDVVRTIAGPLENSLFLFGDVDGPVGVSRLQHPLGVTAGPDGTLYIADTYNSRIKAIDPVTGLTTTIFGLGGDGGYRDGGPEIAEFDEPGGLDYAAGNLYVADTNNNAIRVINLATHTVDTLVLGNIDRLLGSAGGVPGGADSQPAGVTVLADTTPDGITTWSDPQFLAPGPGTVDLRITLPPDYKLNPLIESRYEISVQSDPGSDPGSPAVVVEQPLSSGPLDNLAVTIPARFVTGSSVVRVRLTIFYCETESEQLCVIDQSDVVVPVTVGDDGASGGAAVVTVMREVVLPPMPSFGGIGPSAP